MKFIKLESRGGNYLVVAENIAWLRTAENGQTNVGMVGGQPLLVVGSIEEVAEKILNAMRENERPEAAAPAQTVPAAPDAAQTEVQAHVAVAPTLPPENTEPEPEPAIIAQVAPELEPEPEPEPEPESELAPPAPVETAPEPDLPQPEPEPVSVKQAKPSAPPPAIARVTNRNSVPLWERSVPRTGASSAGLRVKAGSQRFMGKLE
jgi:hypothetical protein